MNPLDALHLQLRLEGKQIVHDNRLRQVEIVPGEEMPSMVVVQLVGGNVIAYYDENLRTDLYTGLAKRMQGIHFPNIDPLLDFLDTQQLAFDVGHYKTYLFPMAAADSANEAVKRLSRKNPLVQQFGFGDFAEEVYCIQQEGRIVSACVSVRENEQCGEAWVCTDPNYRQQGYAGQVVMAWARELLHAGKIPFYSHTAENMPSAHLAKHMGLALVFEQIVMSK